MSFLANSPEACTDGGGSYQVWTHHLDPERSKLQFSTVQLQAGPGTVEEFLAEQADIGVDPAQAVLCAMGEYSPHGRSLELQPGDVATSALMRFCSLAEHADQTETRKNSGRLEIARRHLWLPPGFTVGEASILSINGLEIEPDATDGMSQVQRKGPDNRRHWCPVGSTPVTRKEEFANVRALVQVGPIRHPSQGVYAVAHRTTDTTRALLEDFHESRTVVLHRPAQPQRRRLYVVG